MEKSQFKVGDRFVFISIKGVPEEFLHVRCAIVSTSDDSDIGEYQFETDEPVKNWNQGKEFSLYDYSIKDYLISEEEYDSPLYQALK